MTAAQVAYDLGLLPLGVAEPEERSAVGGDEEPSIVGTCWLDGRELRDSLRHGV